MKKTIIGATLVIAGTLADIGILISSAIIGATLTEWYTKSGKLWTALVANNMLLPFILAKVLFGIGIVILGMEYFDKKKGDTETGK